MRIPEGGQFVDGNPDGGTIVRAAFLNAVLGELLAILALEDVDPLASGDLPTDHNQVASLLGRAWLRVSEDPPSGSGLNGVWLRPSLLLAGEWPFYIFDGAEWQKTPDPIPEAPPPPPPADNPNSGGPFNDAVHGSRGGGNLHTPATLSQSGFMTPEAVAVLQGYGAAQPRIYRSEIFAVAPNTTYTLQHQLPGMPDSVTVKFAPTGIPNRVVQALKEDWLTSNPGTIVGCEIEVSSTELTLKTGSFCWGGVDGAGVYTPIAAGFYAVFAVYFGQ